MYQGKDAANPTYKKSKSRINCSIYKNKKNYVIEYNMGYENFITKEEQRQKEVSVLVNCAKVEIANLDI